jgi:redox-sensitive bicupin YhaK (pirin superfamily)
MEMGAARPKVQPQFKPEIFMLTLRKSQDRGYADHGWLKSFHSFSFAGYYDPRHMGFGNLRVINEDRIAPGTGFGTHGHRDMEIISYVLSGELAHKDTMGNVKGIPPGDVQRMSAGTGVQHSEFNHAPSDITHFLQIWIEPDHAGVTPSYEQKTFSDAEKRGQLRLVASPDGAQGSVTIHASARLYAGLFDADEAASLPLSPARKCYVHLIRGSLTVNGQVLEAGDAALMEGESALHLTDGTRAEVLVFDLSP